MGKGTNSRIAARLSLGLSLAFLALLAVLHVLEPEFNSGHLISEYQLGDYGFLMSLAFCLLGASALLLALSLRASPAHARWTCWWGLLVIGTAFFIGGVFPPVQTPVIIGYLHGVSGLVAIFGSPITFTLTGRSLACSDVLSLLSRRLQWATLTAWCGLAVFLASLTSASLTDQMITPLPAWVSLANRFMVVTYCIWFMMAAWQSIRLPSAIQ
jgi:hypothetical protein